MESATSLRGHHPTVRTAIYTTEPGFRKHRLRLCDRAGTDVGDYREESEDASALFAVTSYPGARVSIFDQDEYLDFLCKGPES